MNIYNFRLISFDEARDGTEEPGSEPPDNGDSNKMQQSGRLLLNRCKMDAVSETIKDVVHFHVHILWSSIKPLFFMQIFLVRLELYFKDVHGLYELGMQCTYINYVCT